MGEIIGWVIVGIFFSTLCLIEWLLWGKVKEEKNKKYNYAFYIVGTILLVILISIITYVLISIPFPKERGMNRGDWLAFWGGIIGCTIGGVIGGFVAFKIMKYQLGNEKLQAEKDRIEMKKMDLQVDMYKQLVVIINDFIDNIFIDNMNLKLIKNNLILLNNNKHKDISILHENALKALEEYEQSILAGAQLNVKLTNIIDNYQLVVGTFLYNFYGKINTEYKIYNCNSNKLCLNIHNLISSIKNNAELLDSKHAEFADMINKDFISLYNSYLKNHMNLIYKMLREYSYYTQIELLQSVFDEKVEIPKVSEPFEDFEYINTEGSGVL